MPAICASGRERTASRIARPAAARCSWLSCARAASSALTERGLAALKRARHVRVHHASPSGSPSAGSSGGWLGLG